MTAAPAVKERTCRDCGLVKSIRKGQQKCDDCKELKGGGGSSVTGKAAKKKSKRTKSGPPNAALQLPGGFGLIVNMAVDEVTQQTDIHLEQTTKDLGEQNIWLSQAEAQQLFAWLGANMGLL